MDESLVGLMDTKCPHPITNEELQYWTSLVLLNYDFERFRRASLEFFDPQLGEMACRIFEVPADFEETEANVVDLRLCAHIKILELCRKLDQDCETDFERNRFLSREILGSPNIIETFLEIEDGPDVRWFYWHRIIEFIKFPLDDWKHEHYYGASLLGNERIYFSHNECHKIIRDVIFPKLELREWSSHDESYNIECLPALKSLCNRRKTLLAWSIEFASEKLVENLDQMGKAMSLLHLLLVVAFDKGELELFDESLTFLLSHPTDDIRMRSNLVILWIVRHEWEKLERIAKHSDAILKTFDDRSARVREYCHRAWTRIACNVKFGPKGRQLMRDVIDLWLQKLDKMMAEDGMSDSLRDALAGFARLIMPRLDCQSSLFDLRLESDQLLEHLISIAQRKDLFVPFCEQFFVMHIGYIEEIRRSWYHPPIPEWLRKVVAQLELIIGKAGWRLARQSDADQVSAICLIVKSDNPLFLDDHHCNSNYPLDEAEYCAYCEHLVDSFNYLNSPDQISRPERFKCFFNLLQRVGFLKWNEEKMRAMESCIIAAAKEKIKLDDIHYLDTRSQRCSTCRQVLAPLRLAYFEESRRKSAEICEYPHWNDDLSGETRGIQSRRLILVSMCKLSVLRPQLVFEKFVAKMVDLLDELQSVYKLRSTRVYNRGPAGKLLLPTCTELAFPSPFDDPESSIYICEFAFFKDTLSYLRRQEPKLYEETVSKLDEKRRERLVFYLEGYDGFDACCAATGVERDRTPFQCIEHRIVNQSEPKLCPLLKREPFSCD